MTKNFQLFKILKNTLLKSMHFLARTDLFLIALAGLIVLLTLGTIAQKNIGLYAAQEKYFSSFIVWFYDIPFPSGFSLLTFIFVGLLCKTILEKWSKQKLGTLITHIAVLLLFLGGGITAFTTQEGYMLIPEKEKTNYYSDYYHIELAFVQETSPQEEQVTTFDQNTLHKGALLKSEELPFEVSILQVYTNVIVERYKTPLKDADLHPSSRSYKLTSIPKNKEEELNKSALIFNVTNAENETIQYTLFEDMPFTPTIQTGGKVYKVYLRHQRRYLPFQVQLNKFEARYYPGSSQAQSYSSDVTIHKKNLSWHGLIEMNEPLRYEGYTLYQSSFVEGVHNATVLAVVQNKGRLFPYIASILMCVGLLVHLVIKLPKLYKFALPVFILLAPNHSWANEWQNSHLQTLPILENGRLQPLESFAREYLLSISGKEKHNNIKPLEFIFKALLEQEKSYKHPLFYIANPQVIQALNLPIQNKRYYSFSTLITATSKQFKTIEAIEQTPPKHRTLEQQQLLDIYNKVALYYNLSRSFSLILPNITVDDIAANQLNLTVGNYSYLDILPHKHKIEEALEDQRQKKAQGSTALSILKLYNTLIQIEKDQHNTSFRIIPAQWGTEKNYYSPWELLEKGQGSPKTAQYLKQWQILAIKAKEGTVTRQDLDELYKQTLNLQQTPLSTIALAKLKLESIYSQIKPFNMTLAFYILSFILLLFKAFSGQHFLGQLSRYTLSVGILIHFIGIASRIFIMGRPPVATLYESILFVAFIAVLISLILQKRRKDNLGIFMGSLLGSCLLFIAMRYAHEGNTMGNLVAVLNTNFWLATHVVVITIGYGCCLVAGTLGHIYLVKHLKQAPLRQTLDELHKNMLGASLIALFFTLLGTILGGIWADQSWGRFWGWDPKENGAMLICLWLIFLLHGRIAGLFKPLYFAAGLALTNIVVALAWFGVNLLGVGLHSYGFTQNIALNLALFCLIEITFVGSYLYLNIYKNKIKN